MEWMYFFLISVMDNLLEKHGEVRNTGNTDAALTGQLDSN